MFRFCVLRRIGVVACLIFFVDFFIKNYLKKELAFRSLPLIKNILHITVVFNNGIAFGLLKGKNQFLIYLSIIFILIFLYFITQEKKSQLFVVASGLVLGGALSNLYDRVFLGYVVDYIDIRVWPVFNLSDSAICIGVFLLLLDGFKRKR